MAHHRQIDLRFRAAMPHRTEQAEIESRQPRQHPGVQPVIFAAALPDQPHVARMRHDYFMPELSQQPADPGRMRSGLQCHSAVRYSAEPLFHRLFGRRQLLLDHHFACRAVCVQSKEEAILGEVFGDGCRAYEELESRRAGAEPVE